MRLQLGGSAQGVLAPVVLTYYVPGVFSRDTYIGKGYSRFDAIVIGAGGGKGGDYGYTASPNVISCGGGGGGGGSQRAQGLLRDLDSNVVVTVGTAGSSGDNGGGVFAATNAVNAALGSDGGPSSFGTVVQASGGKGGGVKNVSDPLTGGGSGGQGGLGGTLTAGGGGTAGTVAHGGPAIAGGDGSWSGDIGEGGGGGAGGSLTSAGTTNTLKITASASGKGSYSPTDTSVADPTNRGPDNDFNYSNLLVRPGVGGGATALQLTGLTFVSGTEISTFDPNFVRGAGFVAILLT